MFRLRWWGLATLFFLFALTAHAENKGAEQQAKAQIAKNYARMAEGWQKHQVAILASVWAPNYSELDISKKTVKRKDAEAVLASIMHAWRGDISMKFVIQKFKMSKDGKTAETDIEQTGEIGLDPKDKSQKSQMQALFHHIWTKTPQGWRLLQQSPRDVRLPPGAKLPK